MAKNRQSGQTAYSLFIKEYMTLLLVLLGDAGG